MQELEKCCDQPPKICYVCGDYFIMCKVCDSIVEINSNEKSAIEAWNDFMAGRESGTWESRE